MNSASEQKTLTPGGRRIAGRPGTPPSPIPREHSGHRLVCPGCGTTYRLRREPRGAVACRRCRTALEPAAPASAEPPVRAPRPRPTRSSIVNRPLHSEPVSTWHVVSGVALVVAIAVTLIVLAA